jgi:cellulose synthase/poly-beta-1,6-N-acetylglucosamine synthase-like glycosyltransferase
MSLLDPTTLLFSLDWEMALAMFWYLLLLDIPRYTLAFIAVVSSETARRTVRPGGAAKHYRVSAIVVGHNERTTLRRCVRSLKEQTYPTLEIVCVDDGSTDGMSAEMQRLRDEGLIDITASARVRSGKASASNLGISRATGEVIVIIDADCTFDRDAIAEIVAPFSDAAVGAVSGNIGVRNATTSLLGALQAFEYLVTISLGKRILDTLGIVTCASGAFSAFRTRALSAVGGFDAGPGEDLDLTLRLRQAGWKVRFAENAWCLTDVPTTLRTFIRQRLRWERDALRLRLRKHRKTIDPLQRDFVPGELLQQLEFVVTNLLVTLAYPIYIITLFDFFGMSSVTVLIVVSCAYIILDFFAITCAVFLTNRPALQPPFVIVLIYGSFNAFVVRTIRLVAYVQEWVFESSRHDDYVPLKVRRRIPLS